MCDWLSHPLKDAVYEGSDAPGVLRGDTHAYVYVCALGVWLYANVCSSGFSDGM